MKKQPLFRNGRFYNNEMDSIVLRLMHAAKVFLKHLPKLFFKDKTNHFTQEELANWSCFWCGDNVDGCSSKSKFSVTWVGHSTFLIQLDGINILTDPIFRPISRFFPRHTPAALSVDQLPKIDVILISHNHRDHMDIESLQAIKCLHDPLILLPHGDEELFRKNGFNKACQMYWWDTYRLNREDAKFTFLPAVHWSGRGPFDINKSMWGSWMININNKKIYFAGDSAFGEHFALICERFPNIDLALIPIGPCQPRSLMAESHLDPEEAINAFIDLDAKCFIPMHWGAFKSGFESVLFPIKLLQKLWDMEQLSKEGRELRILRIGQTSNFDEKC